MFSNHDFLDQKLDQRSCTFLGLGPMSLNSIDAIIKCSKEAKYPIFICASRNQIEMEEYGGGYANNWSTSSFMEYVKSHKPNLIIGRDHGGPNQSDYEKNLNLSQEKAISNALKSLKNDMAQGMSYIHLDPSRANSNTDLQEMINVIVEMYGECEEYAQSQNKNIIYEISNVGHSKEIDNLDEYLFFIDEVLNNLKKNNLKTPSFSVINLGNCVLENKNNIEFEKNISSSHDDFKKLIESTHQRNLRTKLHNADYLSSNTYQRIVELGIDGVNIAPELGIIETQSLLKVMTDNNLTDLKENFIKLCLERKYWEKWTLSEDASNEQKTLLSGHYIYSTSEFVKIKKALAEKVSDLDQIIQNNLTVYILNLMEQLKLKK